MSAITLYGIANCDTVRKARRWLDQQQVSYAFHDFRKDGLQAAQIKAWLSRVDREALLNKRGRTWRELSAKDKQIETDDQVIALCTRNPTVIKRPVLVTGKQIEIGFDPARYQKLFTA